jgi:hypothetical protein
MPRADPETTDSRRAGASGLEEAAVPVACPIGLSTPGNYGHSRTARYAGSPAYRQADPLRIPTFLPAGRRLLPRSRRGRTITARPMC